MPFTQSILDVASRTSSLAEFEAAALAMGREALDADVGVMVSFARADAPALVGFDALEEQLRTGWDSYGEEIAPVRERARRVGVASDRDTLGRALEGTRIYREVMAPLGGTESLFVVPTFRDRPLGLLMLGRTGRRFSRAARTRLAELGGRLGVAWAAATLVTPAPGPALTAAERDLLGYLELGYTTREIATGRGTSFYTVRNQLSALYRKLGVSNRTEAVGLSRRI